MYRRLSTPPLARILPDLDHFKLQIPLLCTLKYDVKLFLALTATKKKCRLINEAIYADYACKKLTSKMTRLSLSSTIMINNSFIMASRC